MKQVQRGGGLQPQQHWCGLEGLDGLACRSGSLAASPRCLSMRQTLAGTQSPAVTVRTRLAAAIPPLLHVRAMQREGEAEGEGGGKGGGEGEGEGAEADIKKTEKLAKEDTDNVASPFPTTERGNGATEQQPRAHCDWRPIATMGLRVACVLSVLTFQRGRWGCLDRRRKRSLSRQPSGQRNGCCLLHNQPHQICVRLKEVAGKLPPAHQRDLQKKKMKRKRKRE